MANPFRTRLGTDEPMIGLFTALVDPVVAELLASVGFDWLLIDAEHATNTPRSALTQLQAIAPYPVAPVLRPVSHDATLLKQYLDIGVQTVLAPMVDTADDAKAIVRATRYPPAGIRGVGASLARAARWGGDADYLATADDDMFVICQIESATALDNIEAIAAVDGVDSLFVGPSDLAASMGHLGNPRHPDVESAVLDAIGRISAAGLAPGVYASDPVSAKRFLDAGVRYLAVGSDVGVLRSGAAALRAAFG